MRNKLFILWFSAFSFVPGLFAQTGISPPDAGLFDKAVACIKEAGGWHGNHLPHVGYGHKILPHKKLRYGGSAGGFLIESRYEETA